MVTSDVTNGGYLQRYTIDMAMRKHKGKEEHRFEVDIAVEAMYNGCAYQKIEDPIYTRKRVKNQKEGFVLPECKRLYDGILVIKRDDNHHGGLYAIEAKYNSNRLLPHQLDNLSVINNINGMGYVLRKTSIKGKKDVYTVEWPEKNVLYEAHTVGQIIKWFKELSLIENKS